MATPGFDRDFWEQLWSRTLRERPGAVADRAPNAHLIAEVGGRALDAGCGHGSETFWLAAHGWHVTAVDFSAAALAHARSMAEAAGTQVAGRVDWVKADLETWTPAPGHYDLVACLYVHVAGHSGGDGPADGGRRRAWRRPLSGRAPPDRSRHRGRNARGRPGAGLGRSGGRRANSGVPAHYRLLALDIPHR